MTHCIKTGAYVYLDAYNMHTPADIFQIGQDFVILRLNPEPTWSLEPLREVTHKVFLPPKEINYFISLDKRTWVVPSDDCKKVIK